MNSTDVAAFLYHEAAMLDERRWSEWVELYLPDCEFWVPAWRNEDDPTSDPKRELSLIYYADRAGLEDRVGRALSGRSVASAVLPRTQHAITNVRRCASSGGEPLHVQSNWTTQQFMPKEKTVEVYFGRYEHTLVQVGDAWRIARKKVLLLNDYLNAKVDFYSL